jgi:NADH-quinone oxidoreductase subunit E
MTMSKGAKDTSRTEVARAVNLFAHPVAGAAALSALGIGVASQAFGFWMGVLTGTSSVSQRLVDSILEGNAGKTTGNPAKADAETRIELAESTIAKGGASTRKRAPGKKAMASAKAPAAPATGLSRAVLAAEGQLNRSKQPAFLDEPLVVDDLKAIAGVGPKLEQVLNGLGIRSYRQIAAWSGEEIAAIEDTLGFSGRIVRDDWIGRAAKLAQSGTKH